MTPSISTLLQKYKTEDRWLGTRATASFEAEMVKALEGGASFSDFKKILKFLSSNDMDDSATGLDYLYKALNDLLQKTATDKDWPWVKEYCFQRDDRFLESVLSIYSAEKYRPEIFALLDKVAVEEKKYKNDIEDLSENDLSEDDYFDLLLHSASYYKAVYLRNIVSPDYEKFVDEHLDDTDMKRMKADLMLSRGEDPFNLVKDDPDLILFAAGLLPIPEREQYLLDKVLNGKEYQVGMRRAWWDKLCETAGDKYIPELLSSPKHCEMVNWVLYKFGRYEELMRRIDTGWIYDDLWGKLNDDVYSKYQAVKVYKKLRNVYPERCARILIDYSVFMIEKNSNRKSYHISAETIARAGKLNEECSKMAIEEAKKLAEKYPKRTALLEELRTAGLIRG